MRPFRFVASACCLLVSFFRSAVAADTEITYYGEAGDGSAAVALPGGCYFAVAEDEFNTLRIYKAHPAAKSGKALPVWSQEFSALLGVKEKDECDLEGAARIKKCIFWIGSHGFHDDGSQRRAHRLLFATDIITNDEGHPELKLHGKPYGGLIDDLLGDDRLKKFALVKAATLPPKTREGLNIEALCATPAGHLLIGFRGPILVGDKALLVTLTNPLDLVGDNVGAHAKLGDIFELDLGKERGFRDMAPWRDGYLIVAGHFDKKDDFALYSWTGKKEDAPKRLPADFRGLRPEALVVYPDEPNRVQVLSDDGKQQPPPSGSGETKHTPKDQRGFGSLWIDLPPP